MPQGDQTAKPGGTMPFRRISATTMSAIRENSGVPSNWTTNPRNTPVLLMIGSEGRRERSLVNLYGNAKSVQPETKTVTALKLVSGWQRIKQVDLIAELFAPVILDSHLK